MLVDVASALMDTALPVLNNGAISNIPDTGPGPPQDHASRTHIDFYMYDVISTVQGRLDQKKQLFDGNVSTLKWIFPYMTG